jgi:uncharacterized protein (DUF302 family)
MRTETTLVHCEHRSPRPYDEVIAQLEQSLGAMDGHRFRDELAASVDAADFEARMKAAEGASGFMTFFSADHGAWMSLMRMPARAKLYVVGNPLIARTMLKHDVSIGLDVPVRLIVYEQPGEAGCRLAYDLPSSLMTYTGDKPLLEAARRLDAKLGALAEAATGVAA